MVRSKIIQVTPETARLSRTAHEPEDPTGNSNPSAIGERIKMFKRKLSGLLARINNARLVIIATVANIAVRLLPTVSLDGVADGGGDVFGTVEGKTVSTTVSVYQWDNVSNS